MDWLEARAIALEAERDDAIQRADDTAKQLHALNAEAKEQNREMRRQDRKLEKLAELSRKLTGENGDMSEVPLFHSNPYPQQY